MFVFINVEHDRENKDANLKTEGNDNLAVIQYIWRNIDGEATLYVVQNCEGKKEEVVEEIKPKEWS